MQILQLRLPDFVTIESEELTLILASHLYEQGKLSMGQAAELAGLPKRKFMELLGHYPPITRPSPCSTGSSSLSP